MLLRTASADAFSALQWLIFREQARPNRRETTVAGLDLADTEPGLAAFHEAYPFGSKATA